MNNLYYVVAYNHRRNERARFMATSDTHDRQKACDRVMEQLPADWVIDSHSYICRTCEDFCVEL